MRPGVRRTPLALGAGDRTAHRLAQFFPGGALAALALGLVAFGAGWALGGGAVTGRDLVQAEFLLDEAALGLGPLAGAEVVGAAAVLAHQGGDDVDVVVGVPYGGPAAGRLAVARIDAGGGYDPAGDLAPLLVGKDPVARGGAHGGVPHVLGGSGVLREGLDGLVEELLEVLQGGFRIPTGIGGMPSKDATRCGSVCSSCLPGPYR